MSGSRVVWKSGDSRSIKLTKGISELAYRALNTKEMTIRSNRNKFIIRAINSQVIIESGTLEEKLRLIGIEDLSILEIDKVKDSKGECKNMDVKHVEETKHKIEASGYSRNKKFVSSIPTL